MKSQKEVKLLFQQLQSNNFTLPLDWLPITIKHLISCNLLFYNTVSSNLTVQNQLLEGNRPQTSIPMNSATRSNQDLYIFPHSKEMQIVWNML